MSYTDVGKDAKRAGTLHPKHARQIDPEPPRATPKAKPPHKADKPFGIAYEYKSYKFSAGKFRAVWVERFYWYKREAHRDQALTKLERDPSRWRRNPKKVTRDADNGSSARGE